MEGSQASMGKKGENLCNFIHRLSDLVGGGVEISRVVPDIQLAGYPVSFAGYPAGQITGYSVKLLNKRCELRMSKFLSEPFQLV